MLILMKKGMFEFLLWCYAVSIRTLDKLQHNCINLSCIKLHSSSKYNNRVSKISTFDVLRFSQRVSIACYAKRCTSYRKSVCHSLALCQNDSS